jgi:BirA family biotin operon repressor/biotin-[acetyl-CoA-carboxylase] ligase
MKIGGRIIRVESCTSTNDLVKKWALKNIDEGTVVISNEQTHGKGTKGRAWFSPDSLGLYMSVILRPPHSNVSLLSLVGGLAAVDAVFEALGIRTKLKWPNDIIWKGRKLGGILSESTFIGNQLSHVILGLGLNISHKETDFPAAIRSSSVSLRMILGQKVNKEILLKSLWKYFNLWYERFLKGKEKDIIRSFQDLSILTIGEKISLRTEKEELTGIYDGLDEFGGLILKTQDQEHKFFSAQVMTLQRSQED